jgi:hypothetical protein
MKTLSFYGSSDDLFEMDSSNPRESDEFSPGYVTVSVVDDVGPIGLRVHCEYVDGGVWMLGVSQLEEDAALPDWNVRFSTHSRGYSALLTMDVPDDAHVRQGRRK